MAHKCSEQHINKLWRGTPSSRTWIAKHNMYASGDSTKDVFLGGNLPDIPQKTGNYHILNYIDWRIFH